jgi:hypothetical protein
MPRGCSTLILNKILSCAAMHDQGYLRQGFLKFKIIERLCASSDASGSISGQGNLARRRFHRTREDDFGDPDRDLDAADGCGK